MDGEAFYAHGQIRFDLSAELVALDAVSPSSYEVSNDETDLSALDASDQNVHLNSLIDQLALISPDQLPLEKQLWDDLRTFLKYFESLQDTARSKVADGICSSFGSLIALIKRDSQSTHVAGADASDDEDEQTGTSPGELRRAYCQAVEMWSFLVNWLLYMADKVANSGAAASEMTQTGRSKARGGRKGAATAGGSASSGSTSHFPWTANILPALLGNVAKFLDVLPSNVLYPLATPRDALLSTLLRPTLHILERESNLKASADLRTRIFAITCVAVKRHGQLQTAQTMLLQMLQYYEHLPEVLAQLLTTLRVDYDYPRLGEELLAEIAHREFGSGGSTAGTFAMTVSQENKTPRVFARFLVAFAEANVRSTLKTISLLRNLVESEAYPIRNALVEIFAILIKELVEASDESAQSSQADADEPRETSLEAKQKQIEAFWNILFERFLDVNSYVRVKVLNVCLRLCDLPAKFPAQRAKLLALTQRGLKDKSSSARKACVALLTRLILTHPYGLMHGGELDEEAWQSRVNEVAARMQALSGALELPSDDADDDQNQEEEAAAAESSPNAEDEEDREAADDSVVSASRATKAPRSGRKSLTAAELSSRLSAQDAEALGRLKLTHRYYSDALTFIQTLASSMPVLEELLYSQSKAEALEAMDFFRVAAEYKLPGAEQGMRKMIHLVWTKDNTMVEPTAGGVTGAANAEEREAAASASTTRSIKGRLIEVYVSLYFAPLAHLSDAENVGLIARNLVQRTRGASLAELTSLEELLSTMCSDNLIPAAVVEKLWAVYATPPSARKVERSQRRGAIIVLSMLAAAKRQIVQEKIDTLLGIGLGPLGVADPVLAKWSVVALGRVGGSAKKVKGALSDKRTRFAMSHPMFGKLRSAIVSPALASGGEQAKGEWFSLAEHCVQVIYELGEQPDRLCGEIIRWFTAQVFSAKDSHEDRPAPLGERRQSTAPSTMPSDFESQKSSQHPTATHAGLSKSASAFQLAQLTFIVGHVALKQVVYLENVEREYKRRKAVAEQKVKDKADNGGSAGATRRASSTATRTASGSKGKKGSKDASKEDGGEAAAPPEDELEQVAGNVEDEIGEVVGEIREKELLFGGYSLLALFGPLVVHITSNPKTYASDHLRKAAVLTLCKFMCVSSSFCEANLSLLLHILATSSDPTTRSNVVIALGDIAVSFGNLIDENSDRLYAGLNDKDLGVKKHTLMVLTHLILNGMIKVKGQLGEMAKCLEDPEARVSDLAKLFFSELATKENAVYNNLPDIISHLSIGKHAVDEETFERTLKFIFTFVDKEKQAENVVEKLCQRFRLTSAERQWRDIAYCLSLLPYKSERSVKKLIEGLPCYQDKLYDEVIYRRFVEIIAKARSARGSGGSGGKAAAAAAAAVGGGGEADLQDFEQLIQNFHTKGEEDVQLERGTAAKVAKAHANAARGSRSSRGAAQKADVASKSEEAEARPQRATRGGARSRKAATPESDDDDDNDSAGDGAGSGDEGGDSDHEPVAAPPGPARGGNRRLPASRGDSKAIAASAKPRSKRAATRRVVASSDEGSDDDDDDDDDD
ncbi:unnamed protein product [Parajaminaea phylloscopi]